MLFGFCNGKYEEFVQAFVDLSCVIIERKLHHIYRRGDWGLSKLFLKTVFIGGSQVLGGIILKALKPLRCMPGYPTREKLVVSSL